MGTSAFDPIVLADVRSVRHNIDVSGLTGEVLAIGDVIRYDPVSDQYFKAQADSEANSLFVGVIEKISGTSIELVYSGEINLPNSLFGGATAAQVFYLSSTNAGKITATAPSSPGSVVKPVIIVNGVLNDISEQGVDGIVVNAAPQSIGGDSTVNTDDIQPLGTIAAFAGNTGSIPSGWDICDGGLLNTSTFSDLYAVLNDGKIYGYTQTVTLSRTAGANQNLLGAVGYYSAPGGFTIRFDVISVTTTSTNVHQAEILVSPFFLNTSTYHNISSLLGSTVTISVDNGATYTLATSGVKPQFKKPDLRSRFLVGSSRSMTGSQSLGFDGYTLGVAGGEEKHTLTLNTIPAHTHNSTATTSLDIQLVSGNNGGAGQALDLSTFPNISQNAFYDPTRDPVVRVSSATATTTMNNASVGGNLAHNNVPQHVVVYWIIKTRKDSVAKIFRLGPSGGGAVIAKNTPKRWARMTTPGAGCTVDISYGNWTVSRLGTGDYRFSHNMTAELGTGADQTKYIVEATVVGSAATNMLLANPYSLEGNTMGVRIWDVRGATFSDSFQHLCLTLYGGGTAL